MKKYCLVVRYKDSNEVQIIELNSRWYLDDCEEDVFYRKNSLEAIDLVTTKFKSREEMLVRMHKNGYIHSSEADVYIASRRKSNGKALLNTYEVIYNSNDDTRIAEFRDIAKAALKNDFLSENDKVKRVFDKLAAKVYYDAEFRDYLKSTFTNIYQKIIEAYVYSEQMRPAYDVKYKNYWTLSNYLTIRNIIEAMNRFDLFSNSEDKVMANIRYLNENGIDRKLVEEELIAKLDKNYVVGQYSLQDLENKNNLDDEKTPYTISEDSKRNDDFQKVVPSDITLEDKKIFIYEALRTMPIDLFRYDDGEIFINEYLFSFYHNDEDKRSFLNLNSRMIRTLYLYALHCDKYTKALMNFENTIQLEEELRKDESKLKKMLEKTKNIDRLYEWCNAYLKCVEFKDLSLGFQEVELEEEGKNIGKKN